MAKIGIDTKEVAEVGKRVLEKQINNVLEKAGKSKEEIDQATQEEVDRIVNETDQATPGQSDMMKYIPFVVGGALVLFLIAKKK